MALADVTNTSKTTQVINTADGRRKSLAAGEHASGIEISEKTIDRMRRSGWFRVAVVPDKPDLWKLRPATTNDEEEKEAPQSTMNEDDPAPPSPADAAASGDREGEYSDEELIARYEAQKATFKDLTDRAKAKVGDRWPGGNVRKSVVYGFLRE